MCEIDIKHMCKEHFAEVLGIEYANSMFLEKWGKDDFITTLRRRNHCCVVAISRKNSRVLGFVVYHLQADKIHIYNMAVDPDFSRLGVGTKLLNKMKTKLNFQTERR